MNSTLLSNTTAPVVYNFLLQLVTYFLLPAFVFHTSPKDSFLQVISIGNVPFIFGFSWHHVKL